MTKFEECNDLIEEALKLEPNKIIDNKVIIEVMNLAKCGGGALFNKLKREYCGATFKDVAKGYADLDLANKKDKEVVTLFWEAHRNYKKEVAKQNYKGKYGYENKQIGSTIKIRRLCAVELLKRQIDMDKFNEFVIKCSKIVGEYEHQVIVNNN